MDLHTALNEGQFYLLYQPVFDLASLEVCGVEALLRWRHPMRGTVGPDSFLPMLEENGMIVEVGRWVLDQACRQAATWQQHGLDLTMSVNVSMRQLETDDLIQQVKHALADNDLEARSLILEITETNLMLDTAATVGRLQNLKRLGVLIAIDDFGTGYSSLAYLQQFPVDILKIDRSFVAAMNSTTESIAFIRTLVQLGRALGLQIVAEGIEDDNQLTNLQLEQCQHGQGFLLARPLGAQDVETLVTGPGPHAV
jgi:EAL domain-containing protein (putative c-di-GMP-specific phosphodiesterase class I)